VSDNNATVARQGGFGAALVGGAIGSALTAALLFFAAPGVLSSKIVRQGLLLAPLTGAITLTVVLVVWFWAIGVTRLVAWWRMRDVERSWVVGLNGALSLVLGVFIWADLPDSSTWAIGLLVGIELLFAGSALIMTALAGRRLARMT